MRIAFLNGSRRRRIVEHTAFEKAVRNEGAGLTAGSFLFAKCLIAEAGRSDAVDIGLCCDDFLIYVCCNRHVE